MLQALVSEEEQKSCPVSLWLVRIWIHAGSTFNVDAAAKKKKERNLPHVSGRERWNQTMPSQQVLSTWTERPLLPPAFRLLGLDCQASVAKGNRVGQLFRVVVWRVQVCLETRWQWKRIHKVPPYGLQYGEPTEVLERLDLLETRHRMQKLYTHGTEHGTPVKEEQVTPTARVLHCILNEVHYGVAVEFLQAAKAEVALVMFNAHVPYKAVELESQTEDVVLIRAVAHYKWTIRFVCEQPFSCLSTDGAPVPTTIFNFLDAWCIVEALPVWIIWGTADCVGPAKVVTQCNGGIAWKWRQCPHGIWTGRLLTAPDHLLWIGIRLARTVSHRWCGTRSLAENVQQRIG